MTRSTVFAPFDIVEGDRKRGIVLLADHARRDLPDDYGSLGLPAAEFDRHIAYVTAEESFRTPFARSYEVLETLPHREKPLRAALRERGVGRLTIKKRGTAVDPDQLRRQLRLSGDGEQTIVLTRVSGRQSVLAVRPLR